MDYIEVFHESISKYIDKLEKAAKDPDNAKFSDYDLRVLLTALKQLKEVPVPNTINPK